MKWNVNGKRVFILCLLVALLIPSVAFCNGNAHFIQGSKSQAMGNAFVGLADNPSAVIYNPAGIVQLDKTQFLVGCTVAQIYAHFESSGNAGINKNGEESRLERQDQFIPNVYITHKINDRLAVGFGEYTLYGASFIWEDKFEGRYVPSGKEGTIQTVTLSPVVAFKIIDGLSVGLGGRVEYLKTVFDNLNYVAPAFPQPNVKMTAKDWAPGWDVALLYKITDNFSTGIHYRSEINHKTEGDDVKFSPQLRMLQVINTKASFEFSFPQNVTFGFAWSQGPVTLTLDGTWWNWSHSNDKIVVKFKDQVAYQSTQTSFWNWNDSWSVGIGGEYKVNALGRNIALRAGYMWDQSPVPDETVSPAGLQGNNHLFSIGAGFPIGPLYTDLFASYTLTEDREWNNSLGDARNPGGKRITGTFENCDVYMAGIDLTYKF